VQPGVIRDELNGYLEPYGLFFGPNTSTSNRCMIGGMVGNNSSGTTSIRYGVTRDKVLEIDAILSDGSKAVFKALSQEDINNKKNTVTAEGKIYHETIELLKPKEVQAGIVSEFPDPQIHRRNTGYAIDEIINSNVFNNSQNNLNLCKLLTGSEGTLAISTAIKLALDDLPPSYNAMVAFHFNSIENCLKLVEPVMQHHLYACEMMDDTILNLTKHNKTQEQNRFFIEGNPKAILMCELRDDSESVLQKQIDKLLVASAETHLSYAYAVLKGDNVNKAVELRKAGLGLLGNMVGDKKAVACIEDTAVALNDLPNYISEFTNLMKSYGQEAVYYAHAGAGELHLRPILNLKDSKDVDLFREITTEVSKLIKKYKGSMSGEHGDGIVRGAFIPDLIGPENYRILKKIKSIFDPHNIFNPGKIVDAYPMDKNLRYQPDKPAIEIKTILDFSESKGILREAEKCNGSGDCRKLPESGGVMCPSYHATRNEKDTTRARANALREFLTTSEQDNRFNHAELKSVFDLCLSCKACASECPSSVDVASLKSEFQHQYQQANGIALRTKLFAFNNTINKYAGKVPRVSNFVFTNKIISTILKKISGIATQRHLPIISIKSLDKIIQDAVNVKVKKEYIKQVYFFNDEFTNYLDTSIGVDALELLEALNYKVIHVKHKESGRALISKGLLEHAKNVANFNIKTFKDLITENTPLIGIEPSAILTFRDEYLKLADDKESAKTIAKYTFLIEEFIQNEIKAGNISSKQFHRLERTIKFHGHCYQKALSNQKSSFDILNLPENYNVSIITSGCCGMAGSFGYEKEHYAVSMQIGEQLLFPKIRNTSSEVIIAANGTSCRHQIKDGTQKEALHPVTILKQALI
ncbi:MAG: FAD-binding protein, partial [Winogradskyella sp.]|nr:FAD-binding protein [Winogradskyella sp.]